MIQTAPRNLTDMECFYLARLVAGLPVSPYLPIGEHVRALGKRLQDSGPEYRLAILQQAVGRDSARVLAVNPAVMPGTTPEPPISLVAAPQNARQHWIYADDLRNLPQPRYALEEYPIYEQGLNVLFGASGAGKSFVAIDIAGRLALAGATVVYIAAEGLFGYSARWECWKAHNGKAARENLIFWDSPLSLPNEAELESFMTQIAPHKPNVVIVDTVARCMPGYDENSTNDMGLFVSACDQMRHRMGVGVLAIHHTGKDGRIRGSSVLFASSDSVLFLKRDDNEIKIVNEADGGGKNKYSEEAPPRAMTLIPKAVEVDGKLFESAVLVDSHKVFVQEQQRLKRKHYQILEALEGFNNGLTIKQIEDATQIANSSIYRLIRDLKEVGAVAESGANLIITESGREALFNHG